MTINFTKPTIYFSHPIRGSNDDLEGNCKKAMAAARRLRKVFPEVDFYVPADHDLTLQLLWRSKRLDTKDLMWADLQILDACDGWMFYYFDSSRGSEIEWDRALEIGLTSEEDDVFSYDIEKLSYDKIRRDFAPLIERAKKHFLNRK